MIIAVDAEWISESGHRLTENPRKFLGSPGDFVAGLRRTERLQVRMCPRMSAEFPATAGEHGTDLIIRQLGFGLQFFVRMVCLLPAGPTSRTITHQEQCGLCAELSHERVGCSEVVGISVIERETDRTFREVSVVEQLAGKNEVKTLAAEPAELFSEGRRRHSELVELRTGAVFPDHMVHQDSWVAPVRRGLPPGVSHAEPAGDTEGGGGRGEQQRWQNHRASFQWLSAAKPLEQARIRPGTGDERAVWIVAPAGLCRKISFAGVISRWRESAEDRNVHLDGFCQTGLQPRSGGRRRCPEAAFRRVPAARFGQGGLCTPRPTYRKRVQQQFSRSNRETNVMQVYLRIGKYLWPYRRMFLWSIACAAIVSVFWAMNLSIAFPIVKVLFQNGSLQSYVESRIGELDAEIRQETAALQQLEPDRVERRSRTQKRLSDASHELVLMTQVQKRILPYIPNDKFETVTLILGILLAATFLKGVFIYLQELLVGSVVQLTVNAIRQDCFRTALRLDYQSVSRIGASSLMSRMTNDIEQMTVAIRVFGVSLVREPLKAGACTAMAFFVNWRLTLLAVTVVPLLGLVFHSYGRKLRRASHRTMESMASIYACISESFSSTRIVIAFSGFRQHRKQFLRVNRDYYNDSMKVVRLGSLVRPVTEMMAVIAVFAAMAPGAYLVLRETHTVFGIRLAAEPMEIAELTMLYALLAGTLDPVRRLSGIFSQIKRGMAGCERVFALIDEKSIIPEPKSPRMMVRHCSAIAFQGVSFRYQGLDAGETPRPLALKDVSLEIPFGEVVAVVGGNGSGKSTLVSLLPRFVDPAEGRVLIDGVDIRELRTHDLRSQIGLVTQETMLFNTSICENIRYGCPTATRAQIEEAARQAQALPFISQLPEGFDTALGDKGGKLSGGQRQRIALARAIVRDPAILILDEATSAVDSQSEEVIHKVLKQFSVGRTVFIISHVLNRTFLDLVTHIVVLDQGRLVAAGTHDQLMLSCPQYRSLSQCPVNYRDAA